MKKIFKNIFLLSFVLVKFSCFAEADQEIKKVYVFNFEFFNFENPTAEIKAVLEKFGIVDVIKNTDTLYNVKVTTDLDEEELVEEICGNGFSYEVCEDEYFFTMAELHWLALLFVGILLIIVCYGFLGIFFALPIIGIVKIISKNRCYTQMQNNKL